MLLDDGAISCADGLRDSKIISVHCCQPESPFIAERDNKGMLFGECVSTRCYSSRGRGEARHTCTAARLRESKSPMLLAHVPHRATSSIRAPSYLLLNNNNDRRWLLFFLSPVNDDDDNIIIILYADSSKRKLRKILQGAENRFYIDFIHFLRFFLNSFNFHSSRANERTNESVCVSSPTVHNVVHKVPRLARYSIRV